MIFSKAGGIIIVIWLLNCLKFILPNLQDVVFKINYKSVCVHNVQELLRNMYATKILCLNWLRSM